MQDYTQVCLLLMYVISSVVPVNPMLYTQSVILGLGLLCPLASVSLYQY